MNKKVFQKEVMSHNLIGFITFSVLNMIRVYIPRQLSGEFCLMW